MADTQHTNVCIYIYIYINTYGRHSTYKRIYIHIYKYIYGRHSTYIYTLSYRNTCAEEPKDRTLVCVAHLERHDPPLHHRCKEFNGPTGNVWHSSIREKEELAQTHFGLKQLQTVHLRVVFEHQGSKRVAGAGCQAPVLRSTQDHKPIIGGERR